MDVNFCIPPGSSLIPYPAVPFLAGCLKQKGHNTHVFDLNVLAFNDMLNRLGISIKDHEVIRSKSQKGMPASLKYEAFVYEYLIRNIICAMLALPAEERQALLADISWGLSQYFEPADGFPKEEMVYKLFKDIWSRCKDWARTIYSENQPSVTGFHIISQTGLLWAIFITKEIRHRCPDTLIVFGGHCLPQNLLELAPEIDLVVNDEGEETLVEIVERYGRTKSSVKGIHGISFLSSNGEVKSNPPHKILVNLDDLPFPDYSVIPIEQYPQHRLGFPVMPVVGSRGCVSRCAFCVEWLTGGKKFRPRSPYNIASEIQSLNKKFGNCIIRFNDSLINADPDTLNELCDLMISQNQSNQWIANARLMAGTTQQLLHKMHRAGCVYLSFGLESASPRILKRMNKGIHLKTAEKILKDTARCGIHNHLFLIIGFPGETDDDLKMTLDFLNRNQQWISSISPSKFSLLDNSVMMRNPGKFGISTRSTQGKYWLKHSFSYADINSVDDRVNKIQKFWTAIKGSEVSFPFTQVLQHL